MIYRDATSGNATRDYIESILVGFRVIRQKKKKKKLSHFHQSARTALDE